MKLIAGVDEVGRGPLAGPVMAAAVILDKDQPIVGLADSKLLSAKRREVLCETVQNCCVAWAVGRAEVSEIDQINIFQASLLAMQRAINALTVQPQQVQVDGKFCPKVAYPVEAIINGDNLVPVISAASIVAKVMRDRVMTAYSKIYPQYGFEKHKGYGTTLHLAALKQFGITPIHRKSFAPVNSLSL